MVTKRTLTLCLFTFLTITLTANGTPVAAPAPSIDCTSALVSMADCLTFVEKGSTIAKPEKGCCSGLKEVVKKNVECLCESFKSSQDFGIDLNFTKAFTLPDVCKVKTPPFSKCNISLPGSPTPTLSPSPSLAPSTSSSPSDEREVSPSSAPPLSAPSPSKSKSSVVRMKTPFFTLSVGLIATILSNHI